MAEFLSIIKPRQAIVKLFRHFFTRFFVFLPRTKARPEEILPGACNSSFFVRGAQAFTGTTLLSRSLFAFSSVSSDSS